MPPNAAAPFRLDGELAVITGGGTGLGLAVARCMADAGAWVVLAGRREHVLREAAEAIGPNRSEMDFATSVARSARATSQARNPARDERVGFRSDRVPWAGDSLPVEQRRSRAACRQPMAPKPGRAPAGRTEQDRPEHV